MHLNFARPILTRHKKDRVSARSTAATGSVASSTNTTEPRLRRDTNNGALHVSAATREVVLAWIEAFVLAAASWAQS